MAGSNRASRLITVALTLALGGGALLAVAPTAAFAQAATAADVAKLEGEIARLDRELREQKAFFLQQMANDQQRYEVLLQLIRSLQAGAPAGGVAALPPAGPATPAAGGAPSAALPGAPSVAPAAPVAATVSGQVHLPEGVQEAYVYFEGRGPTRARAIEIKQQGKQFTPQIAVVPVGSKITFPNTDTVFHNVFSRTPGAVFDLGTVKGGEKSAPVTMAQPGHVEIFCNIHSRMRADVLVVPNAHFTKLRADGSFSIAGVPLGSRKLVVWGPGLKPSGQVVEVKPGVSVTLTASAAPRGAHTNKFGEPYRSYDE